MKCLYQSFWRPASPRLVKWEAITTGNDKKEAVMPILKATTGGIEIEDGEYEATLLSIAERPPTPNSPTQEPFLLWTFQVYDTAEGVEMAQATSMKFGPKANARRWAQALADHEITSGEDFDLESLCPRECRVVIEHNENGFARITNVLAQRRRPAPKRPASHDGVEV